MTCGTGLLAADGRHSKPKAAPGGTEASIGTTSTATTATTKRNPPAMRVIKPNWVEHAAGELFRYREADNQARRRRRAPSTPSPCIPMERVWRPVVKVSPSCQYLDLTLT